MPDTTIHDRIGRELEPLGGVLRCDEGCRRTQPIGDAAAHSRNGWPKCCGYTMCWWTQRQIDAGEMPTDA